MCIISHKELPAHNRYIVLMENINAKACRLQPNYYYFPWQPLHTVSHLNCLHYNTWERHLVHGASFLKLSLFEMVHLKLPRQLSDFQRTRHGTWAENSQQFNFFEESHRFILFFLIYNTNSSASSYSCISPQRDIQKEKQWPIHRMDVWGKAFNAWEKQYPLGFQRGSWPATLLNGQD